MRKSMVFLASGLVAALGMAAGVHGEPTADKEAGRVRPAPGAVKLGDPAPAPGVISDGNARIAFDAEGVSYPNSAGFYLNIDFPYGFDHGYEVGWFIRGPGDPTQVVQPPPATAQYEGNRAVFTWTEVASMGADATLEVLIHDTSALQDGTKGVTVWTLTVSNPTSQPQVINLFAYADLDLAYGSSDHTATLIEANNWMRIVRGHENGETFAHFRGIDADRYVAGDYSDVRDLLDSPDPVTLDNSGLPFGPGDFAGAFQWQDRTLPAHGSLQFQWVISIDESALLADRLFAGEFECDRFLSCPGVILSSFLVEDEDASVDDIDSLTRRAVNFETDYVEAAILQDLVLRLRGYDVPGEVVVTLREYDDEKYLVPGDVLMTFNAPPPGGAGTGDYRFVPNGPFVLQPHTYYWLEVTGVDGGSFDWMGSTSQWPVGIGTYSMASHTTDGGASWWTDYSVYNIMELRGMRP